MTMKDVKVGLNTPCSAAEVEVNFGLSNDNSAESFKHIDPTGHVREIQKSINLP